MRKCSRISGLFLCILTLCVCSCGGGGSAADPMGTGTVQFVDETGAVLVPKEPGNPLVLSVMPGESRQLIVWVTNARDGGKTIVPVIGEEVTFSLLTPGNGGSITMVKDETDGNGRAVGIYTAGNNFETDEVRATTKVGATAQVTIMKTGGIVGARISSLAALPTTVAADQTSVVTAKVTDGNGNPMMGEAVMFTLPVNASGASFVNAAGVYVSSVSVTTDASGNATAIYTAGYASSDTEVYDTVQAELENGSSNAVVITRSAPTPTTDLSVSVVAAPTSVSAGQVSIVTATLTGDDNVGVTVTFSLSVNNSGATLSASSAVTDGSGNAVVTYRAGSNNPTLTVDDTVKASVGSISSSAAITRSSGTVPSGAVLTLSAEPTAVNGGQTTVITATVTGGTSSGANESVTLTIPVNNSGASFLNAAGASVATVTITTGSGGTVSAVYKAGPNTSGAAVQDTVQGVLSNGALNAVTITVNAGVAGNVVTVTANPSTLTTTTGVSIITANVKNNLGSVWVGATVTFTVSVAGGVGGATVTSPATTDGNGNAISNYSSTHNAATSDIVTATTTIDGVTYTGATTISVP